MSSFTKGGKWEVVKDLKNFPTHEGGGVDLVIGGDGVRVRGGESEFHAANGLVMGPGDPPKKPTYADSLRLANNTTEVLKWLKEKGFEEYGVTKNTTGSYLKRFKDVFAFNRRTDKAERFNSFWDIIRNDAKSDQFTYPIGTLEDDEPLIAYDKNIIPQKLRFFSNKNKVGSEKEVSFVAPFYDPAVIAPTSTQPIVEPEVADVQHQYWRSKSFIKKPIKKQDKLKAGLLESGLQPLERTESLNVSDLNIPTKPSLLQSGEYAIDYDGIPNVKVVFRRIDGKVVPVNYMNAVGERIPYGAQLNRAFQYPDMEIKPKKK